MVEVFGGTKVFKGNRESCGLLKTLNPSYLLVCS